MAQQVSVLGMQAWRSKFNPWSPGKAGRKELTSQNYLPTSHHTTPIIINKHLGSEVSY